MSESVNDVAHFEQDLKVGDKVLVTKPKGDCKLWHSSMDRYDGEIYKIEGNRGLHFWKLKGPYSYRTFHEGWLTKITSDDVEAGNKVIEEVEQINAVIEQTNEMMKETIKGLEAENESLREKLRDVQSQHQELVSKHSGVNFLAVTPMNHIYRF